MRRLFTALSTLLLATACATTPVPAVPGAPQPKELPPETFRQQPPEAGKPPELVLPRFEQARLDNGLTVLVSTRKELPLVFIGVASAAGSAQDPRGKAGLAQVTYRMLLEGAGGRDTIALDNAFSDLGVSPMVDVTTDGAFIGVQVLKRHADGALGLLSDVVRRPAFAPKDFDRRKKLQLAELVRKMGSPGYLAQVAYLKTLFGEAHPYGHPVDGVPATVESLSLADVKSFYQRHVGPQAAALVMTGDITLEEAVALARRSFGDWSGRATLPPVPPAPAVSPRQQVLYVPKPGLEQTIVVVGRPGLDEGHPDKSALQLATMVFGGFFGSRLNMNLREAKGYSYGAGAQLDPRLGVGPLVASTAVRADVTGPALDEVMKELAQMKERPITPKELEAAREGLIRSFPGSFETVDGLGTSAAQLFFERRPLDEFTREVAALEKATLAEVQRAAETYLDPAAMQVVLVGSPDIIQGQVNTSALGRLTPLAPPALPAKK